MTKLTVCLVLLVVVGQRSADAQVYRDPLAPVSCFQIADDLEIASTSAIELCAGASTSAPGQCFAAAAARGDLATQDMVSLCRGATSNATFECYERLAALETLTKDQIVQYCGMRCPLGPPPPEAGNPACVAAAIDLADLPDQTAGELCFLASSAAPVQCFIAGDDLETLADSQLVQLCAEIPSCQYINAPTAAGY